MPDRIRLEDVRPEGDRVVYRFSTTLPFVRGSSFFIGYDAPPARFDRALAAVPFAAAFAPLAWMTGAALEVGPLDAAFLRGLSGVRDYFRARKAGWSFGDRLFAEPVQHAGSPSRDALLYSGGLDSLTSYARHRAARPVLVTVIGADVPIGRADLAALLVAKARAFAAQEGVELRTVRTDVRTLFDAAGLRRYTGRWWGEVAHGLILTTLGAPAYRDLRRLWIASSHQGSASYAAGSDVELDRHLAWGGLRVEHDYDEADRLDKIRDVFRKHPELHAYLTVCFTRSRSLNCGACEKCSRTVVGLLLCGIDPADCGFPMGPRTLEDLSRRIASDYYYFFKEGEVVVDFWRTMRDADRSLLLDRYGAAAFLRRLERERRFDRPHLQRLSDAAAVAHVVKHGAINFLRRAKRRALGRPAPEAVA